MSIAIKKGRANDYYTVDPKRAEKFVSKMLRAGYRSHEIYMVKGWDVKEHCVKYNIHTFTSRGE